MRLLFTKSAIWAAKSLVEWYELVRMYSATWDGHGSQAHDHANPSPHVRVALTSRTYVIVRGKLRQERRQENVPALAELPFENGQKLVRRRRRHVCQRTQPHKGIVACLFTFQQNRRNGKPPTPRDQHQQPGQSSATELSRTPRVAPYRRHSCCRRAAAGPCRD